MMSEKTSLLNVLGCENLGDAQNKAANKVTNTGGYVFPCLVYKQGPRSFLSTAFTFPTLVRRTNTDSPKHKAADPEDSRNRAEVKDHTKKIRSYVRENDKYILPAFTLATNTPINFYSGYTGEDANIMFGFAVISGDAWFWTQDGQHRRNSVEADDLIGPNGKIRNDGAAVVICVEDNVDQIHQDFADCAKSKPIHNTLKALWNTRDPFSQMLKTVANKATILKNRVEKAGQNSKGGNIYTINNLRQGVAVYLTGNRRDAGSVGDVTDKMAPHLGEGAKFENQPKSVRDGIRDANSLRLANLFDRIAEGNEQWRKIVTSPTKEHGDALVETFRNEYLHFSPAGLLIICQVARQIEEMYPGDHNAAHRDGLFREMGGKVDWNRTAAQWQGNVMQNNQLEIAPEAPAAEKPKRGRKKAGVIVNQSQHHIVAACNAVCNIIGIPTAAKAA
jgi:DNA sulfur modification protein DndB